MPINVGWGLGIHNKARPGEGPVPEPPFMLNRPRLEPPGVLVAVEVVCTTGVWENEPTSYTYQWVDQEGIDIPNANENNLVPTVTHHGKTITCVVTAHNAIGLNSASTFPHEVRMAPIATTEAVMFGSAIAGNELECIPGVFMGTEPINLSYQWYTDGQPINGATSLTYVTNESQNGQDIICIETGSNILGSWGSETNILTLGAAASPPVNMLEPVLLGNPESWYNLFCDIGIWKGTPLFTYEITWYINDVLAPGRTGQLLTLDDVLGVSPGDQIKASVKATNQIGNSSAFSNVVVFIG